jgi:hypothetical protein
LFSTIEFSSNDLIGDVKNEEDEDEMGDALCSSGMVSIE